MTKLIKGAFCSLEKFGGKGWGIQIEEDGDVSPGMQVEVRKKGGDTKTETIEDVIYEDPWKVVCTIRLNPDDRPPGSRKGSAKRKGAAADVSGTEGDDPRPLRKGRVRGVKASDFIDLGGTRIKRGLIDLEGIFDL